MPRSIEEQKEDAIVMMIASNVLSSAWTETVRSLYNKGRDKKLPSSQFSSILRDKIGFDERFLQFLGHSYGEEQTENYNAICQFSELILKLSKLSIEDQDQVEELINRLYESSSR